MPLVSLERGHGLTGIVLFATAVLANAWAPYRVMLARKVHGVKYPLLYAPGTDENATKFNCIQRAHQNLLENLPTHYILTLLSSVYRPEISAVACAVRLLGFVYYFEGYSTGVPENRFRGKFGISTNFRS